MSDGTTAIEDDREVTAKSHAGDAGNGGGASSDRNGKKPRRINVAVTPDMIEAIELIMDKEEVSLTEAVRRLVSYGDFVYRAIREDNAELIVKQGDKTKEVVLLT